MTRRIDAPSNYFRENACNLLSRPPEVARSMKRPGMALIAALALGGCNDRTVLEGQALLLARSYAEVTAAGALPGRVEASLSSSAVSLLVTDVRVVSYESDENWASARVHFKLGSHKSCTVRIGFQRPDDDWWLKTGIAWALRRGWPETSIVGEGCW